MGWLFRFTAMYIYSGFGRVHFVFTDQAGYMSSKAGSPFVPSKTLIDAKFEGYKLHALSQADCVNSFPLPNGGASQVTASKSIHRGPHSQFSFKEVQDRITFNHLAVGLDGATLGYIDKDGIVTLVQLVSTVQTFPSLAPVTSAQSQ